MLAGVSAGISFLCKEIGICSILFLLLYSVFSRKSIGRLEKVKASLVSIGIGSSWFVSGLLSHHQLFIDILTIQLQRSTIAQTGYQAVLNTAVREFSYNSTDFIMGEVSFLLLISWICLGIFIFGRGYKIVKIGLLSFLITLAVMKYAWFFTWIGIFPFFSIAIANVIYNLFQKARLLKSEIASKKLT